MHSPQQVLPICRLCTAASLIDCRHQLPPVQLSSPSAGLQTGHRLLYERMSCCRGLKGQGRLQNCIAQRLPSRKVFLALSNLCSLVLISCNVMQVGASKRA